MNKIQITWLLLVCLSTGPPQWFAFAANKEEDLETPVRRKRRLSHKQATRLELRPSIRMKGESQRSAKGGSSGEDSSEDNGRSGKGRSGKGTSSSEDMSFSMLPGPIVGKGKGGGDRTGKGGSDDRRDLLLEGEEEDILSSPTPIEFSAPLPIYWINLNSSNERRKHMETTLEGLILTMGPQVLDHKRVEAVDTETVQDFIATGKFVPNGVQVVPGDQEPPWIKHQRKEYTEVEVACLISHLKAIQEAYRAGHEMVLILEDDAVVTEAFLKDWKTIAGHAPSDWTILNLATSNEAVLKHGMHLRHDPWINWLPDHYGTVGYIVNRNGMREILKHTTLANDFDDYANVIWKVDQPELVVADEVIYYFAKTAYTSTYPWIRTTGTSSTLGIAHDGTAQFYESLALHSLPPPPLAALRKRSESIVVLMNCRLSDEDAVQDEVHRLKQDVEALSRLHSETHWVVNFVLVNPSLKRILLTQIIDLPKFVDFRVSVSKERFNKYDLIADVTNDGRLLEFDYVLVKDNDMRIAGFPWNAFLDSKGDSTIAGPLHQGVEESLAQNIGSRLRQYYKFHEARPWKDLRIPEYEFLKAIPTDFVEQAFVLAESEFAHWFFNRMLHTDLLSQSSDWGLDFLWCQAAFDFYPEKKQACTLVPLVALHEDTRQLKAIDYDVMVRPLRYINQDTVSRKWFQRSTEWEKLIGGGVNMKGVLERCDSALYSSSTNLTECTEATASTFFDWRQAVPRKPSESNPIVFLHVPKTGGTSLDSFLAKQSHKWNRQYHGYAHFDWSHINQVGDPRSNLDVVTLLREPTSRAVSQFHYAKTLEWSKEETFFNQTLDGFLEDKNRVYDGLDDGHGGVYWLAGTEHVDTDWILTSKKDELLLHHLRQNKTALCLRAAARLHQTVWFGILEDLPRSMELLEHTFGVPLDDFPTKNQNVHSAPSSEAQEKLRSMLPMDIWLYDYAKLLFEARWDYFVAGSAEYRPPELPPFPWDAGPTSRVQVVTIDPMM